VVVPLLATYVLFSAMVGYAVRHPVPRPPRASRRPPPFRLASTIAGGYLAFLLIVLIFHVWIVGQRAALGSAVAGGAFLSLTALITFLIVSWIEDRWRSRRRAHPR
jgi:Family of unknown function (DUF6256)